MFTLDQIIHAITKLKPDAAPGYDNIYNKHIIQNYKSYNFKLAKIILKMNNCCRLLDYWPKIWAIGKIFPMAKQDADLQEDNKL